MMRIAGVVAEMFSTPAAVAVRGRYHEPWRRYHDWSHPLGMIGHLASAEADGVAIVDPVAAVGFVLWHDSIYDPRAAHGRNEGLSAMLCRAEMGAEDVSVGRALEAIGATVDHIAPDRDPCPDGALLLDIDLAILGAADVDFDRYDVQIADEYAHVPAEAYRTGRTAVLRRFLDRDRLYLTDWGFARWEARARDNLARAIAALV